jgi:hypothetical protein
LGMFEGHRSFIGWGAVALGVVALLAAVTPRDGPGKRRRGPPVVDFDAEPAPVAEAEAVSYTPAPPTEQVVEAEPEPVAETAREPDGPLSMGRSPSPSSLW